MARVIKFPGNRRPAVRQEYPATIIILPVVRIEPGPVFTRALKRYSRKRKQPKVLA